MALRKHQEESLVKFIQHEKFLDGSKPGTGKTPSACVFTRYIVEEGYKVVWVHGLRSILKKNYNELIQHGEFTPEDLAIVDTTPAKRAQLFANDRTKVFLMGADCFANNWQQLVAAQPSVRGLIYDEIHMACGNPQTKRSKAVLGSSKHFRFFLGMSGSFIDGKLSSVYVPLKVVAPLVYPTYNIFLSQHGLLDDYGNVVMWFNHDKLKARLDKHWVCYSFEEVYGKASADIIRREVVTMSDSMRKSYAEMEAMAMTELDNMETLTSANEGVNLIRCRQIMSCPEHLGLTVENLKDESLLAHLTDALTSQKKVMVLAAYVPEQERIYKLATDAGLRFGLMNGNVPNAKRIEIDEKLQRGELDGVVGSPQVMAVGFNWEFIDHVIFNSLTYKDTDFIQAIRRANRGTRKYPLRVTVLEYEKSLEDKIWWMIHRKSLEAHRVDPSYPVIKEWEG